MIDFLFQLLDFLNKNFFFFDIFLKVSLKIWRSQNFLLKVIFLEHLNFMISQALPDIVNSIFECFKLFLTNWKLL